MPDHISEKAEKCMMPMKLILWAENTQLPYTHISTKLRAHDVYVVNRRRVSIYLQHLPSKISVLASHFSCVFFPSFLRFFINDGTGVIVILSIYRTV